VILNSDSYVLVSAAENRYWAGFFPDWGALATFIAIENGPSVIEPHYHDNDEFWLWIRGRGGRASTVAQRRLSRRARWFSAPWAPCTSLPAPRCSTISGSPRTWWGKGARCTCMSRRMGSRCARGMALSSPEPITWGRSRWAALAAR